MFTYLAAHCNVCDILGRQLMVIALGDSKVQTSQMLPDVRFISCYLVPLQSSETFLKKRLKKKGKSDNPWLRPSRKRKRKLKTKTEGSSGTKTSSQFCYLRQ